MHSGSKDKPNLRLIACVIALGTLAVYWRVIDCGFVHLDDNLYVYQNKNVQAGLTWAGLKWAFRAYYASNWHPLTWVSLMLDCQLFGVKPGAIHLVNLLFHVANTLLLFAWLRRLTGTLWRSALVAALFAWHPLHVESVAWIAERKDVLSTFFWLLTLLAYHKYKTDTARSKSWYAVAFVFFLLGLLAKPMVVTLPFVLLLVDYWMAQSEKPERIMDLPWKRWLLEKIPFLGLVIGSCALTYLAQKAGGAVEKLDVHPLEQRAANAAISYVRYLGKTVWPDDLVVVYPHPGAWQPELVFGAVGLLLCVTALALWFGRKRPWLPVGWFWYLGTLVPVIGIVQVGRQAMADRYMYIPSIGIFVIVAWGLHEWAQRNQTQLFATGAAMAALAACMGVTWHQIGYWKNSGTLFKHDIQVADNNYLACYDLGLFSLENDKPGDAVTYFENAVKCSPPEEEIIKPALALSHNRTGMQLVTNGAPEKALSYLRKAVELQPHDADFHRDLAGALKKKGDLTNAASEFKAAAQINANDPALQMELAQTLAAQHDLPDALAHYREAARLYRDALKKQPDSAELLNNLAWVLAANPNDEIRNGSEAVKLARRACELTNWKQPVVIGTLAAACAEAGEFDEAADMARKAHDTAVSVGLKEVASRNEELLKLYLAKQPYRDNGD